MLQILEEIYTQRKVYDRAGKAYPLHSETPADQIEFLTVLLERIDAWRCLEIGLAYGISSLAICNFISSFPDRVFYSVDPYQSDWHDIGLRNLEAVGFSEFVRFFREPSSAVLPRLQSEGVVLDFVYIDSSKVFDVIQTDVFYCTRMLRKGGVLVLDDCGFPGLRKLARYLAKMPHWNVVGCHGSSSLTWKRDLANAAARLVPGKLAQMIVSPQLLDPWVEASVNGRCIAFEKVSEDERRWDWFADF
jgi:predicted O-methyltransferase YrrM